MARGKLVWTVVLATMVVAGGCSSEHEGRDDEDEGLTRPTSAQPTPSSPTPTPTPEPAATPAPTPTPTPTPAPSGTAGGTAVAYDQDVAPILRTDCTRCHSSFSTYGGTLNYVQPGSAGSLLVTSTQPGGSMYSHLSGDRAAKADTIRRWVVDYRAQQSR